MGKSISIRLSSPEDEEEFERRVEAGKSAGKGPSTIAKELVEQALREQRQNEELRHRLETMESKIETLQEEQRSFGRAILMAITGIGTDKKLTGPQALAWLEKKGFEK